MKLCSHHARARGAFLILPAGFAAERPAAGKAAWSGRKAGPRHVAARDMGPDDASAHPDYLAVNYTFLFDFFDLARGLTSGGRPDWPAAFCRGTPPPTGTQEGDNHDDP